MISHGVILRAEAASRTGELAYVLGLRAIMRGLHTAILAGLQPHLADIVRMDATRWGMGLEDRLSHFIRQLSEKVGAPFDAMASSVARAAVATQTEMLGERPSTAGLPTVIGQKRAESVALMERAGEAYGADMSGVLADPKTWDLTVEELQAVFSQIGDKSMSRAALIARDQVYKTNAAMTEQLQRNAGVDRYRWSTCRDERVRPTHRRNEGRIFHWSSPPPVTGHPGHDPNCRCLPLPLVPQR